MPAPEVRGRRLGVVLGSGPLGELLDDAAPLDVDTPWGAARLHETPAGDAVVLRRHDSTGDGYLPAHRIDHHRNVAALCAAGCDRVLAIASVGALRRWPVGSVVAPFDFYAPFVNPTFHDDVHGHSVAGFDIAWRDLVLATWASAASSRLLDGGVYAQTPGPRFESPAEVRALAAHADVVGMTVASELVLAGEAGIAYTAVCVVDNLANGLAAERLSVDDVHAGAEANRNRLVADLRAVVPRLAARPRPTAATEPAPGPESEPAPGR
jgi:5'-methylthioadenosine phosphorylase